jgi:thiol:disulfide interchange protein DsbD
VADQLRIRDPESEFPVVVTVDRMAAFRRRGPWWLPVGFALLAVGAARAGEIDTRGAKIQLDLISEVTAIRPGQPFRVGLKIQHDPGWHTYWRQPGIVGVPTSLTWELPEGFRAGQIQWPAPERVKMSGLTAWGFERSVLLMVEITPPDHLTPGAAISLNAKGAWMACARTCHPGWGDFHLALPVAEAGTDPLWDPATHALFEETAAALPRPLTGWSATVATEASGELHFRMRPENSSVRADPAAAYYLFPYTPHVHSDEPQALSFAPDGAVELTLKPFPIPAAPVERLPAVLEITSGTHRSFVTLEAKWLPANLPN